MPFPFPGDLPSPGTEPKSLTFLALLTSHVAQSVKHLPPMWETWIQFLGQEVPLEKEMATHSSILARKNPMDRGVWLATVHGVAKSQT